MQCYDDGISTAPIVLSSRTLPVSCVAAFAASLRVVYLAASEVRQYF